VRTLVVLALAVVILFATIVAGTHWSKATLVPKLALDLEGGTQVILTPVLGAGSQVTDTTITEAIRIIRQRVDSSGVSEAQITSQGGGQGGTSIVVGIPGKPDQATLDLVRKSALMRFRAVLAVLQPQPKSASATPTASPSGTASASATASASTSAAASPSATASPTASPSPSATPTSTTAPITQPTDTPTTKPTSASDQAWVTPSLSAIADALDCTNPDNRKGGGADNKDLPLVTCDPQGATKYVLGPAEIEGKDLSNATSGLKTGPNGVVTGEWIVELQFNGDGAKAFGTITTRMFGEGKATSPSNQFAMVLDGLVISAPAVKAAITDGRAEISGGNMTRQSAADLANQLSFGALPLTFKVVSEEQVSATLGGEQLQRGLLAGLIGLILVVFYSMLQYRTLGLVTVASLTIAGMITYGLITLLSWTQGYRLSLPGVAGIIVSIGITADSFIVFFERVRDELREGRTLAAAIDQGWERARRTIVAADGVNFLAAVVLYFLAVGGVRGFAYTLGLTTLVDLLVVFTFTHPVLRLLARVPFFTEGHKFSGLDPSLLGSSGVRYRGRGQVGAPALAGVATQVSGDGERLTIAERHAAAARSRAAAERNRPTDAGAESSKGSDN
jgi:preprotein translocase subunit SecD